MLAYAETYPKSLFLLVEKIEFPNPYFAQINRYQNGILIDVMHFKITKRNLGCNELKLIIYRAFLFHKMFITSNTFLPIRFDSCGIEVFT